MVLALLSFQFSFQDLHQTLSLWKGLIIVLGYSFSSTLVFSSSMPELVSVRCSVVFLRLQHLSVTAVKASSITWETPTNMFGAVSTQLFPYITCCSEIMNTWETSHFLLTLVSRSIIVFIYFCTTWKFDMERILGWVQDSALGLLHCSLFMSQKGKLWVLNHTTARCFLGTEFLSGWLVYLVCKLVYSCESGQLEGPCWLWEPPNLNSS